MKNKKISDLQMILGFARLLEAADNFNESEYKLPSKKKKKNK
jgi:hypothetical protein